MSIFFTGPFNSEDFVKIKTENSCNFLTNTGHRKVYTFTF